MGKTVGQINILRNFRNWSVSEETGREINEYLAIAGLCRALDGRASPSGSSSEGSALTYPAVSPEVVYQPSVQGFPPAKNTQTLPWDVFLSPSHRHSLSLHWLDEPRAVQLRNSPQRSHQEVLLISISEFLMLHICSQRVGWGRGRRTGLLEPGWRFKLELQYCKKTISDAVWATVLWLFNKG